MPSTTISTTPICYGKLLQAAGSGWTSNSGGRPPLTDGNKRLATLERRYPQPGTHRRIRVLRWRPNQMVRRAYVYIYIYIICIIYTLNLGFGITVFDEEREEGRFRGSNEGAGGSTEEPALYPAIAARVIYDVRQHCCQAQPPAA